jgi:cobalt/nickel transport protein
MNRNCLLFLIVLGFLVITASGHTLYAEFPDKISPNSDAKVWIAYGHTNAANETELSSLAVAQLVSPSGTKSDLELGPFKGGLLGKVKVGTAGCYILNLQMDTSLFNPQWFSVSGASSLVEKYGRVLMTAGSGEGYDWSEGRGLEIVPLVDPFSLKSGDEFSAKVLWNGKPVGGSYNGLVARSPSDVLMIQHVQDTELQGNSQDGSISFKTTRPGLWVLTFDATIDEKGKWQATGNDPNGHYRKGDDLEYDEIAPTAYLTFWVWK